MIARIHTVAFYGIDVLDVDVEVQMSQGLVSFKIVGLPDKTIAESKERVRSVLYTLGLSFPAKRITVNLAPADVVKEGSHFDLPIALGLLTAMGVFSQNQTVGYFALGELSLDGRVNKTNGVLPAAVNAVAKDRGLICPESCGGEALWAGLLEVIAPPTLLSLINHFKGIQNLPAPQLVQKPTKKPVTLNLRDLKGQETAKRALEIVASGGHNMMMIGPPGSGKSMLALRLPGILPPLELEQALETSMIHSVAGLLQEGQLIRDRPFRDPHHSASLAALVGGGQRARPGEISLAHNGVLFLDEFPEFSRNSLEALRQPLETGQVSVARANHHITYPARTQLITAMNPCRCGYLSEVELACSRAPLCGKVYQDRISGPMFDRIDCHVEVPMVRAHNLLSCTQTEDSELIAQRVAQTLSIQNQRYKNRSNHGFLTNASVDVEYLEHIATPDQAGQNLLFNAIEHLHLSARAYHRVLRVARTIADMEQKTAVSKNHIAEALSFRRISPFVKP